MEDKPGLPSLNDSNMKVG